jgi:exopolysaccharide biosynthesis polyprenyl glycosylphosphotransferase
MLPRSGAAGYFMNAKFRRQTCLALLKIGDLMILGLTFLVALSYARTGLDGGGIGKVLATPLHLSSLLVLATAAIFWHLSFISLGLYHSRRLSTRSSEISDVIAASLLGCGCVIVACNLLPGGFARGRFFAVFLPCTIGLAILSRLAMRFFLGEIRRHGRNLRSILIFGTNPRALQFAQTLEEKADLGYRIVGFVDNEWDGLRAFESSGMSRVADLKTYPDFLRSHIIDEVSICLPIQSSYKIISEVMAQCTMQGIVTRVLADFFEMRLHTRADMVDGRALLTIAPSGIRGGAAVLKTILDRAGSFALLTLLSPLLLLTAIAIKLTSAGPVFFTQARLGRNKRPFRVIKFRTMFKDAEQRRAEIEHLNEAQGPVFKIARDPRITRVGRILRKLSIDELPQLINVLKGDMSLVGPRPLPVRDYEGFDQNWHLRRFSVLPGISCLWQIGGRSNIQFDRWMELDMQYIDQWSLWLDLKILLKTIPAVLKGEGAC